MKVIECEVTASMEVHPELLKAQGVTLEQLLDNKLLLPAAEDFKTANQNRLYVIQAALSIEGKLTAIIVDEFYGSERVFGHEAAQKALFENVILGAMCDVGAKLKLVQIIAAQRKVYDATFRSKDVSNALHDVMKYRNAFAHGTIKTVLPETVPFLCYFAHGEAQRDLMTDEFLSKVESVLKNAHGVLNELSSRLLNRGRIQSLSIPILLMSP